MAIVIKKKVIKKVIEDPKPEIPIKKPVMKKPIKETVEEKFVYRKERMTIQQLSPDLLSEIRLQTNNEIVGITIPEFTFSHYEYRQPRNFCSDMQFMNNINISGKCAKESYIKFPWVEQSIGKEKGIDKYDKSCLLCSHNVCPAIIRNECIKRSKTVVKKKVIKK